MKDDDFKRDLVSAMRALVYAVVLAAFLVSCALMALEGTVR